MRIKNKCKKCGKFIKNDESFCLEHKPTLIQRLNNTTLENLGKDLEDRNLGLIMVVAFDESTGKMTTLRYKEGIIDQINTNIEVFKAYNGNFRDNSMHYISDFYMHQALERHNEAVNKGIAQKKEQKANTKNKPKLTKLTKLKVFLENFVEKLK